LEDAEKSYGLQKDKAANWREKQLAEKAECGKQLLRSVFTRHALLNNTCCFEETADFKTIRQSCKSSDKSHFPELQNISSIILFILLFKFTPSEKKRQLH